MHIGPWWIPLFTVQVTGATALALIWVAGRATAHGVSHRQIIGCVWSVTLAALIVGRAGYVAMHAEYFAQRSGDVLALRRVGGLHGGAALAGGILAAAIWTWATRQRWLTVVTLLTPAVLCVAASGWWSCWTRGCAWGQEIARAPVPWRWLVADAPDLYYYVTPRYVVQVLGAGWAVTLAVISTRGPVAAWGALISYPLGVAGLNLLRGDPAPEVWGIRADSLLNLALAVSLGWGAWRTRPPPSNEASQGETQ